MTTYVVTDYDGRDYITAGKRYEVIGKRLSGFNFYDENGDVRYSDWEGNVHLSGHAWTVIEEPDTPKTWGEMTDAEKGALLLAHHDGKRVEQRDFDSGVWSGCIAPFQLVASGAYRIKPEPVVGEMAFGGKYTDRSGVFSMPPRDSDTHTLTLPTLDGKLVTGEFANEAGMKVVIEEKK